MYTLLNACVSVAAEIAENWSSLDTHSVEDHLKHVIPFRHAHYIDVRLVGFSGETEPNKLFLNEDDFHKFFRALQTEHPLSAIKRLVRHVCVCVYVCFASHALFPWQTGLACVC
jgi:hypothetical protein